MTYEKSRALKFCCIVIELIANQINADMLFCVIGANAALLALGPVQDREMRGEAARSAGVTPP